MLRIKAAITAFLFLLVPITNSFAQIAIDNDIGGDGKWEVFVGNAGSSETGNLDPIGAGLDSRDVIYEYGHYVQIGDTSTVINLRSSDITTPAFLSGDDKVTSAGSFNGPNGVIRWTAESSIINGEDLYITKLVFESDQPFGDLKFIQYFDEDVRGVGDDQLVVIGSSGDPEFQLLTVDNAENVGVAQGAFYGQSVGMSYAGFSADEYSDLINDITAGRLNYSIAGVIDTDDLPPFNDSRYPDSPSYGLADITTAIVFEFDPNARFASVSPFIGGSPDGRPIDTTPPERLRTPTYTKFNTYLNQANFLELIAAGPDAMGIGIRISNLLGEEIIRTNITLGGNSQYDVDINSLIVEGCKNVNPAACAPFVDLDGNGVIDTYGLVRLDFEDGDPNKILLGRMSNYRLNPDGQSYSFAMARELRNPISGTSYAMANTSDPQGMGYLVPNWAEIINLENEPKSFIYRLFDQAGAMVFASEFVLQPLGERDLQAGHEINPNGAFYLAEVEPIDSSAEYLMYVSRYSSNSAGVDAATYNFAFSVDGRGGANEAIFAPITNEIRDADCARATNWLEVANVGQVPTNLSVVFRSANGEIAGDSTITLNPRTQFHFNASALLDPNAQGAAEITTSEPNAAIAQSLTYFHDCEWNSVQTAFVAPAKSRGIRTITGSANTFLGMENSLRVIRTTDEGILANLVLNPFNGGSSSTQLDFNRNVLNVVNINQQDTIEFAADSYGTVLVGSPAAGQISGQMIRFKRSTIAGRQRLDFVMPTELR